MTSDFTEHHGEQTQTSKEPTRSEQQQHKPSIGRTWQSQYSITDGTSVESTRHPSTEELFMGHTYREFSQQNVLIIK